MPSFHLVDAFTESPFAGNPAGVVVLDGPAPEAWMQQVAAEVNASETAFVHPSEHGGWQLRWFTPSVEVDLCGHATLATAHVLWSRSIATGPLRFATRSGDLYAEQDGAWIWLDLPAWPVRDHPAPPELELALGGVAHTYLGRTGGAAGDRDGVQPNDVVELVDEDAVAGLVPDLAAVARLGSAGLIVTAASAGGDDDLVSRYFAPNVGVDEDPVTGSAHSTLGPWWAERLGRRELEARQLSARGGRLRLRVDGDRVQVGGHAVTTIVGEITAP